MTSWKITTIALLAAGAALVCASPGAAYEPDPAASTLQDRLGVQMRVKNDTGQTIYYRLRHDPDYISYSLEPGRTQVLSRKSETGSCTDDLEVDIQSAWRGTKVLEIDGSNPLIGYPSLCVEHVPTGQWELKCFPVWDSKYFCSSRAWVQRAPDAGFKVFDVHVKKLN